MLNLFIEGKQENKNPTLLFILIIIIFSIFIKTNLQQLRLCNGPLYILGWIPVEKRTLS